MLNDKDNIYCALIGALSGVFSWLNEVAINESFGVLLLKTFFVASTSTIAGLIVKQIWYKIFPKKFD